ncbi:NERD domain-containing protein [Candidatus Saccharibacteria bacterium]|nr:NERD domain-containing protein [Candidatus Saccharibacteria bacterium]
MIISEAARSKVMYGDSAERAEIDVDYALRKLNYKHYVVFGDLIIPSGMKNPSLTQIDHVVVSIYGIFCIETKSNHGTIYGNSRSEHWKQYLGKQEYGMYSPYRQNHHHVTALEKLLYTVLRAPIHSYIVFPNAKKVVVDGKAHDMSIEGAIDKINKHTYARYDIATVEHIAKFLAYTASMRNELRGRHHDEVQSYVNKKMTDVLKIS